MAAGTSEERRHQLVELGLALVISLAVFFLSFTPPYQRLELLSLDARFIVRPRILTNPDIATIDIDNHALTEEGRWPWTRDKHARVIEIINQARGGMIGFDMYFSEESEKSLTPLDIQNSKSLDDVWTAFRDYDEELAEAARRNHNVFLGATFTLEERPKLPLSEDVETDSAAWQRFGYMVEKGYCIEADGAAVDPILRAVAPGAIPIPTLLDAARGVGFAQIVREADGLVRKYPTFIRIDYPPESQERVTYLVPSLGLAMACDYLQVPIKNVIVRPGEYLEIPNALMPDQRKVNLRIPINERGEMIINWSGDYKDTFHHYPYSSLIDISEKHTFEAIKEFLSRQPPSVLQDLSEMVNKVYDAFPEVDDILVYTGYLYGAYWYETLIEQEGIKTLEPHIFERLFDASADEAPGWYETQREVFESVRLNVALLELLREDRSITPSQAAERLDVPLPNVENAHSTISRLLAQGGPGPADRPLYFLPEVIVEGNPLEFEKLKGGVFFYGLTAAGTHDLNPMPFSPRYPMVGSIANVFNTIVTDQPIRPVDKVWTLPLLLAVGLFTGYILSTRSTVRGSLFTVLFLIGYLLFAYQLFANFRIWIDVVGPATTIVLADVVIVWHKFNAAEKRRKFIKRAFEFYLNPSVVEQIAKNPEMLELGGKEMVLTALFSDVAGFTTISEQLRPPQLVELLNEYLTAMTDIVLKYDGTLDKYEGDAVMAVFGAPIHFPDHATRACYVALEMQDVLKQMREKWKAEGRPELHARIGMNSGSMVVGNMGSRTRFNYTVMGDAVNLASRLEGVNKQYSTSIMISEFTLELCKFDIVTREIDLIRVKGKAAPVKIYEVLGRANDGLPDDVKAVVERFSRGLEAYRRREWTAGIEAFQQALEIRPDDGPSLTYLKRCKEYLLVPPPAEWDGVYVMTTK
jgi:class 3 adenylate cyclase